MFRLMNLKLELSSQGSPPPDGDQYSYFPDAPLL
ncbi:MAG: hypothetical protein OJF51_003047 [Nitrospira sp.]|nr:MAG: hypothetical protein OJF51_003047 [Nitrospira sp.]